MGSIKFTPKNEIQTREWFVANIAESQYDLIVSQTAFPDYILADSEDQEYRVEVEYKSANFIHHRHNPHQCDFVLCWIHNTQLTLPVIELSTGERYEAGEINEVVLQDDKSRNSAKARKKKLAEAVKNGAKAEYDIFLSRFVEDLRVQSEYQHLITPARLDLLKATDRLTFALDHCGLEIEELHPYDLFKLVT